MELLLAAKCILAKEGELDHVRLQLCDSMAVIDVARRAISPDEDWYLPHALQVAIDRTDAACTTLEVIAGEARRATQSSDRPQINESSTE